jgi:hypothetical protein
LEVLLKYGANPRIRDSKYRGTPAGWAAYAGYHVTAHRILEADIDIFDAIQFDRADRIADILDRDPGALDRPFKAYASCGTEQGSVVGRSPTARRSSGPRGRRRSRRFGC